MTDIPINDQIHEIAKRARKASRKLAKTNTKVKNDALARIAELIEANRDMITHANSKDVESAKDAGMSKAMLDRLTLTPTRIDAMAKGLREVIQLPDPVGEVLSMTTRPNGLQVGRVRVPLGVIAIIYESRPNVTVDATGLCLKSGNAVVLRGGSEALGSNLLLAQLVAQGIADAGLPSECVQIIQTRDRDAVTALSRQKGLVDLLIARGSGSMIHALSASATVPVVEHGGGICHVYIHEAADVEKAVSIAVNAKVSRPGVCNSAETFLIDQSIARNVLPVLVEKLREATVEVRGCKQVVDVIPTVTEATIEDWSTEYLDLIVSIKVVDGLDEAIEHIEQHSTRHSDSIVTQDYSAARRFLSEVDSAAVYVNASTRFTDGNEFGLGAEIGISTQKLHARGPMGLVELTSGKFIIYGDGQIRE